jgi:hypothetical protein
VRDAVALRGSVGTDRNIEEQFRQWVPTKKRDVGYRESLKVAGAPQFADDAQLGIVFR